jgi:hypothetical protein
MNKSKYNFHKNGKMNIDFMENFIAELEKQNEYLNSKHLVTMDLKLYFVADEEQALSSNNLKFEEQLC